MSTPAPIKKPRHVVIAQNHLTALRVLNQRECSLATLNRELDRKPSWKIDAMTKERDGINEAIAALEGKE